MFNEIWKDIPCYEGHYQVSDHGRVKSLERTLITRLGRKYPVKEKILKIFLDSKGYCHVCLAMDDMKYPKLVHRLVAESFLEDVTGLRDVNHINGIKSDNRSENLEYISALGNSNHLQRVINGKKKYGVTFDKVKKLWIAQIVLNGKCIKLGRSKDKEKCHFLFYVTYVSHHGVAPW